MVGIAVIALAAPAAASGGSGSWFRRQKKGVQNAVPPAQRGNAASPQQKQGSTSSQTS